MVSIKRIIDKCFIIFCNNSYAYHFHFKSATSYTLERKYVWASDLVGSGRVVSGLEFGRWKHKTETNRPKTVRVGSGRVVSVLVETRPI